MNVLRRAPVCFWEAKRAKVNVFVASCKNNVFVSRDVLQFVAYRLLYGVEGLQVFCRKNIRELPSFLLTNKRAQRNVSKGDKGKMETKRSFMHVFKMVGIFKKQQTKLKLFYIR